MCQRRRSDIGEKWTLRKLGNYKEKEGKFGKTRCTEEKRVFLRPYPKHMHTKGSHTVLFCLCHLLQLLLLQRVYYVCQASFAALWSAKRWSAQQVTSLPGPLLRLVWGSGIVPEGVQGTYFIAVRFLQDKQKLERWQQGIAFVFNDEFFCILSELHWAFLTDFHSNAVITRFLPLRSALANSNGLFLAFSFCIFNRASCTRKWDMTSEKLRWNDEVHFHRAYP